MSDGPTTTRLIAEEWPLSRFVPYSRNPRKNDHAVNRMVASIREFGFKVPVLARSDGEVVDGHLRLKAGHVLQLETVPVIPCDDWTEAQVKAFRLMVNRSVTWADWDEDLLKLELGDLKAMDFDLSLTGFDDTELAAFLAGVSAGGKNAGNLSERFVVPPFSVLDARQGYWQERKRAWLALGIKSEIGRGVTQNPDGTLCYRGSQRDEWLNKVSPGGSPRPACDYSKKERGDGAGRPLSTSKMAMHNDPMQRVEEYGKRTKKRATAIPGGGSGKNSCYKFKTASGYKTQAEIAAAHGATTDTRA